MPHTGLWLYPRPRDLTWHADVDLTSAEVGIGGAARLPSAGGPWERFVEAASVTLATSVDAAASTMRFNTHGLALGRVSLVHAREDVESPIPKGGDLPGRFLRVLALQEPLASQRPMQLIFDTWKAWPKPAPYTFTSADTDLRVSPSRTYPEVEKQVSAQVRAIAFFGVRRIPAFRELSDLVSRIFRLGLTKAIVGGALPDLFSTGRMDGPASTRGPITILPPERDGPAWVPQRCEIAGKDVPCPTQRVGDVTAASSAPRYIDDEHGIGDRVDRTRYTIPYRINTAWWKRPGGLSRELGPNRLERVKPQLSTANESVKSYRCRGHFFAGSRAAQRAGVFGSCR